MQPFTSEEEAATADAAAAVSTAAGVVSPADADSTGDEDEPFPKSDGRVPWIPIDPSQPDLDQVHLLWQRILGSVMLTCDHTASSPCSSMRCRCCGWLRCTLVMCCICPACMSFSRAYCYLFEPTLCLRMWLHHVEQRRAADGRPCIALNWW
jgi:hypothetical protein